VRRYLVPENERLPLRFVWTGLPDFSWYNVPKWGKTIPNNHKIYQITIKYTKRPQSIPKGSKIKQMFIKYTK
jgi:hypothetical protein